MRPISIAAPIEFGKVVLTPILLEMLDTFPNICINTIYKEHKSYVTSEDIDISVYIGKLANLSSNTIHIGNIRNVLCATPDYISLHNQPKEPADLYNHKLINFSENPDDMNWPFMINGQIYNLKANAILNCNIAATAISAVLAEKGITRVPSYSIDNLVNFGALEILLKEYEVARSSVYISYNSSQLTRKIVDHIAKKLKPSPHLDHEEN